MNLDNTNKKIPFEIRQTGRVIARFSCGAASAVATKLAIEKYGDAVQIYYNDTGSEHEDNPRFIRDCEAWFGRKVNILRSEKFSNIYEVFEKRRFLVSNQGAPCTSEMKRIPGESVWHMGDVEIFGYTADESHRLARFRNDNTERIIECPLIDKHLTKEDCLGMIERVGIEIPAMYRLGFRNNNCIGCVKARDSIDYWKRVRKHFPAQFKRTARLERELNVTINRVTRNGERTPIYLDEIEDGDPTGADPKISCGLFCMSEADSFSNNTSA
jgi:3'-phosphoadenosine 5'-phosphosulfate sulfotransferase (PAPS reductase)/FAD synthetase